MAEEAADTKIPKTAKQKLLFYTTAFFILLGIFSLFGFLFLVPFIIEPAYTTIKMDFDLEPAECFTVSTETKRGLSNCSWTSCREGCTREVYECTQILVNYRHPNVAPSILVQNSASEEDLLFPASAASDDGGGGGVDEEDEFMDGNEDSVFSFVDEDYHADVAPISVSPTEPPPWISDTKSRWFFGARLFPNVKGCGYPPFLNCTVFNNTHHQLGRNYSCYYSRTDPSLVISRLDIDQVYTNLVYALVVPIVSFIMSIIYIFIAYLFIYNDPKASEKTTPVRRKTIDASKASKSIVQVTPLALATPLAPPTSGVLSPASEIFREDMASFGNQLKYAMVDEAMLSRESLDSIALNHYSSSMNGNLNKMMTTCILTPPGPIAQL